MIANSLISAMPEGENIFLEEVLKGLRLRQRAIPPKFFYDDRGSALFERICDTPEYYLTRVEVNILDRFGLDMVKLMGNICTVLELGSGSALKTPLVLRHLEKSSVYMPVDICESQLTDSVYRLNALFPDIRFFPVCADYTRLPVSMVNYKIGRTIIFFPGSTIGNATPVEAVQLLRHLSKLAGPNGGLLIGVDNKKSSAILDAAYNDSQGYTAAFNLNLLVRMKEELNAELDLSGFEHYARYNNQLGRVEMHLVSKVRQSIRIGQEVFWFRKNETIHTENSYKYDPQEFQLLAHQAGWHFNMIWTDEAQHFNVYYLTLH
ncbi:MAG: L-histidine N(alpha)-methyltransferase [Pseudomonadota bacterium]|nr:L-histidine N(alpha)-methyltransferase [Pseudomonadota bacterium]